MIRGRRWLLVSLLLLAACGQRGPLYLPGEEGEAPPESSAAAIAGATES